MGFFLCLIVGGLLGWIAGLTLHRESRRLIRHDIIVGSLGALIGAFILGPVLGGGNLLESRLDIRSLLVGAIGALATLTSVHLMRRARGREPV